MPAVVSDIHEITVLIGLVEKADISKKSNEFKFELFSTYANKYGNAKISINKSDFIRNIDLFDRGLNLAKELASKFNLKGEKVYWSGLDDHKNDSSDLYSDNIGISLKDSSKIVRNNGFEQLLKTFCKSTIKEFKDPFWEFSPSLSANFIKEIIKANFESGFLTIKSKSIYIDGKKVCDFESGIDSLLECDLKAYSKLFSKASLKLLVKEFSKSGDLKQLLKIRKKLVDDVQKKVIAVLREGLLQAPDYASKNFKLLLQYTDILKLFGFSCSSFIYAGKIPSAKEVLIEVENVYTEESKLTEKTTGLQINLYTDIEIKFAKHSSKITLQNQLRYKHRTFSCAPEANLHILNYNDWKKVYPDTL